MTQSKVERLQEAVRELRSDRRCNPPRALVHSGPVSYGHIVDRLLLEAIEENWQMIKDSAIRLGELHVKRELEQYRREIEQAERWLDR